MSSCHSYRATLRTSSNSENINGSTKYNSIQQKPFSNQKDNCRHDYLNYSSENSQISSEQINIIVNNYSFDQPLGATNRETCDRINSKPLGGRKTFVNCPPRLSPNGCDGRLLHELPITNTNLHSPNTPKLSYHFTQSYSSHLNSTWADISRDTEDQTLLSKHETSTSNFEENVEEIKSSIQEEEEEEEVKPYSAEGGGSIPMAVGIFVATVVGAPVFFAAGIKLGLFAGMAGGAMGYTTGKMFADHE